MRRLGFLIVFWSASFAAAEPYLQLHLLPQPLGCVGSPGHVLDVTGPLRPPCSKLALPPDCLHWHLHIPHPRKAAEGFLQRPAYVGGTCKKAARLRSIEQLLDSCQSPAIFARLQLELITDLLGTPSLDDMRTACEGARLHVLRQPLKPNGLSALYTLSAQATYEAVHLLCRMLTFDPAKRITAADAMAHPYVDEGRLRYHSCMCRCCTPAAAASLAGGGAAVGGGQPRQHAAATVDFEPSCPYPFNYSFEDDLTSLQRAKEKLYKLIHEQQRRHPVPLCINPNSISYRRFASSSVAHPSELPPSPHVWN